MRNKKIIITAFLIIMLFQAIVPIKVNASTNEYEIVSEPAKINRYATENEQEPEEEGSAENEEETDDEQYVENEMTGLDLMAGLIIEPTVEFLTFILDGIMSVFSSIMTQTDYQFVVVEKEDIDKLPDLGNNIGAEFTISEEDVKYYETASGSLDAVEYPCFSYSPEEIFAGKIDLLDINFIARSNEDEDWLSIRDVVSDGYKIFRMFAIIGLLSVLIYTGIKIILSSNTKDKAKYKQMILNWFIAVILAFSMHYIMAFILSIMDEITGLLEGLTGVVQVNFGETTFYTNLIGVARFQMEQQNFSGKVGHLIIYTAMVIYTFKFTFVYLKRVLRMAFLTVISPIVALTYPIDKMDGEAKGFNMWLKEYIFNAILQPMHYIMYYILVSSSLTLAVRNPIYGIVALAFMSEAERLLKRIFGFDKARAGTVGGIAGAFTTGAITSSLISHVRDPLHPFGGGKRSGKSGGGSSGNSNFNYDELPNDIIDDTSSIENLLGIDMRGRDVSSDGVTIEQPMSVQSPTGSIRTQPISPAIVAIGDFFRNYRQNIPESSELSFKDEIPYSMEEILALLAEYQKRGVTHGNIPELSEFSYEDLENILRNRVIANESQFMDNGFLPGDIGYIDEDPRTTSELMEEVIRLNKLGKTNEAKNLLKKIKRRMSQNESIQRNGGVQELRQQVLGTQDRINDLRNTSQTQQNLDMNVAGTQILETPRSEEPTSQRPTTIAERYAQRDSARNGERIEQKNGPSAEQANEQRPPELQNNGRNIPIRNNDPKDEQKDNAWERFKSKPVIKGVAHVGKTAIKPAWDLDKTAKYNGKRLAGNILKGAAGVTVGVAAAAVQAGISITDGKYNPLEAVGTVAAGVAGVSAVAKKSSDLRKERTQDEISIKQYGEQWYNRDDIINSYNREFPGQGKEMRKRAVNNYVSRGITDFKDQKKAMKFANQIMKERGLDVEEADKIAVATLQYKQNLASNSNYMILFDEKKRKKYLDLQCDAYTGAASKDSVRQLHDDLIQNVRDFDRANR